MNNKQYDCNEEYKIAMDLFGMINKAIKSNESEVKEMKTISLVDDNLKNIMDKVLEDKLVEGAITKSLIGVTNLRGIGKTTALIKFAKKYGFGVLCSGEIAEHNVKQLEFQGFKSNKTNNVKKCRYVIDEDVNYYDAIEKGYDIVTGFINYN